MNKFFSFIFEQMSIKYFLMYLKIDLINILKSEKKYFFISNQTFMFSFFITKKFIDFHPAKTRA